MRHVHEQARTLPKPQFVAQHPGLFLVLAPRREAAAIAFQTTVAPADSGDPELADDVGDGAEVLAIIKAAGNPYHDRISIGRARNCDLVLRDPSVSKLHAHFLGGAGDGELQLVDLGSQNGTLVDGKPLPPNTPRRVVSGSVVRFGRAITHVVDAARLFDLLAFG